MFQIMPKYAASGHVWIPPVLQEVSERVARLIAVVCQASYLRLFTRRGPVWLVRRLGPNQLAVIKVTRPEAGFPNRDVINRHPYRS